MMNQGWFGGKTTWKRFDVRHISDAPIKMVQNPI
jgi:hypothetical protein